jgi:Holliday junction resolvasome RuvABC endonuclease subunit
MGSILVAGLDPAFAHFGIARMRLDLDTLSLSLDRIRTIDTEKRAGKRKVVRQNSDDLRRATELHDALHEELDGCTVAFGEIPSGSQRARAAFAFGVVVGILASVNIPLIQVMPVETKLASVGNKTAEKPEIITWAASLYPDAGWAYYDRDTRNKKGELVNQAGGLHIDNEHAADACAVPHAGIRTPEFQQLLALWKATQTNRG